MINFNKLKIVLFDFDETLANWTNRIFTDDIETRQAKMIVYNEHVSNENSKKQFVNEPYGINPWLACEKEINPWAACEKNQQLEEFMKICRNHNIRMGLISAVNSYPAMIGKQNWVIKNYGIELENYCVSSAGEKTQMLKSVAIANGYSQDEILIVDDLWSTIQAAEESGFQVATPIAIVNWINQHGN